MGDVQFVACSQQILSVRSTIFLKREASLPKHEQFSVHRMQGLGHNRTVAMVEICCWLKKPAIDETGCRAWT